MAIIPQKLYVIRDTKMNTIKPGAKGQFAFDTVGHARRSLVHTVWWNCYRADTVIGKLMPAGHQLMDLRDQLQEVILSEPNWRKRDQQAMDDRRDLDAKISKWKRDNGTQYRKERDAIKFDKQKRFVVESLINVETQEIK